MKTQINDTPFPIDQNWSVPIEAVIRNKAAAIMAGVKTLEMNQESDYAHTFGIDIGDLMFVDTEGKPEDGDLVVVLLKRGVYELDTFDSWAPTANFQGILVGCLKRYEKVEGYRH